MKYIVNVDDRQMGIRSEILIKVRKGTSILTVLEKGIETHLEKNPNSENEETIKIVKALKRECCDEISIFIEDLKQALDLFVYYVDPNNYTYENTHSGERKTSIEVGNLSYFNAWVDQKNEVDGEKDFIKFLPDAMTVIAHGNELMLEDVDCGDWGIVEEE